MKNNNIPTISSYMPASSGDPDTDYILKSNVEETDAYNEGLDIRRHFFDYMRQAKGPYYKLPKTLDDEDTWTALGQRCLKLGMPADIFVGIAFKTLEKLNRLRYSIFPKTLISLKLDFDLVNDFQVQQQREDNGDWLEMLEDNFKLQLKSQKDNIPSGFTPELFICSKPWFRMPAWFRIYKSCFAPDIVERYKEEALSEIKNDSRIREFLKTITPLSLEALLDHE
jgi:hypothetical protein